MTAAGTVDLSLPDLAGLVARAGVDPREEARRFQDADPAGVAQAARAFAQSGGEMDTAYSQSLGAADTLGRGFTNDGAPVLDRGTHLAHLPKEFGDAGTHLAGTSRRLGAVADDLSSAMRDTGTTVTDMENDLVAMTAAWRARVAAAATEGGLIPQPAVPALQAERDRVVQQMVDRVTQAGLKATARVHAYEVVVNDALRGLADQGFVSPTVLDGATPPAPPPAFEGEVEPVGLGTPLQAGYAADPVNTALGNFVEVETDLAASGVLAGLTFARTYNSRSDRVGPFGPGWSSWASTRLVERDGAAEYAGPDGQRVTFPRAGAGFAGAVGIHASVERRADGLSLAWFDGRRWDFAADGRPRRVSAGPGTGVELVHADGRLVALVHDRGRRVAVAWEGDRIVALAASDGRRVDYRYDDDGRLTTADGAAGPRSYGLDDAGRVASVTDADGVVELVNTYDAHGRVLTQRSPFGRTTTFAYAPDGVTVVADDAAGPSNVFRHDHAGRLVAVTDGHGHTLRTRYDAAGNPVEIVERGGGVTSQEFDDRARLVRRATPSGAVYAVAWDDADRVVAVTAAGADVDTATTLFRYEGDERSPVEVVDPEGGVTRLRVTDGLVHAITDPDGVTLALHHDADGHLVEAVDAAGGVTRVERDAAGLPTATVTPAGRRTELVHDAHGRLVARRDPAGGVWRFEYTRAGRATAVVDPTGARTEVRHGAHGEVAELVDALGARTTCHYDLFGNLADLTAADGGKWTFRHDALSRLTAWTDPAGGAWWQDHDVDGRPTGTTDPTGVRHATDHDPAGRLTTIDDGLVARRFSHDVLGRLVTEHRADGTTRHLTHDRCGRLVTETGPDGGTTRYAYSPAGRLVAVVAPSGREERLVHDDRSRATVLVDGNGHRWELRHDPDGLLVGTVSPAGLVETIERDPCGRVVRHRVPGRGTTAATYDAAGRIATVTDRAGRRAFTRDPAGRVVAATDALGRTTHYTYDEAGNLASATDPRGGRTQWAHDEVGRLVAATDPLGRTTAFTYDAAGRLHERHDPTGARLRWVHDPSGRVAAVTAHGVDGTSVTAIERDVLARPVRVTQTGPGRPGVPVTLRWDAGDRLLERRAGDRAVGWSYDADGLRTALTHPDGTCTTYRRDGAGRVTALDHPLLGPVTLDRDPDGRLRAITGRTVDTRYGYSDGWLTTRERDGRRARLSRDDQGRVVAADTDGRTRLFGYDPAGQLVLAAAADNDPGDGNRAYAYDACGRLHREDGPQGRRDHAYDAAGQLTSSTGPDGPRTYRYDEAGRRVAEQGRDDRRDYRWDPFGRLAAVDHTDQGRTRSTRFTVDALGELAGVDRVDSVDGVDGVALSWDSADPFSPLVALGDRAVVGYGRPWTVGDRPVDRRDPADPWGTAAAGPAVGYRGELAVDGLVWLRARAYDPATRAFLTPDPLPPVVGTAVAANPYHYAGNDPVGQADPRGLRPVTDGQLEGHRDSGGGLLSTLGHGALDIAGLIPGVGAVADVANAAWYAYDGDYTMAALSLATAIPGVGLAAFGAKAALKGGLAAGALTAKGVLKGGRAAEGVAEATVDGGSELTRVGRWMGPAEHDAMVNTGMVQEGAGGTTYVAHPADVTAYMNEAKSGTRYVEFDVPHSSVAPAGKEGWAQIPGPNSLLGRLATRKGLPPPQFPPASNIEWVASKL